MLHSGYIASGNGYGINHSKVIYWKLDKYPTRREKKTQNKMQNYIRIDFV